MTTSKTYYKVLGEGGQPFHGGNRECKWSLPTQDPVTGETIAGEWMPPIKGPLEPCYRGYHLTDIDNLLKWLGPTVYIAEYKGKAVEAEDKIVVRNVRLVRRLPGWDERTARLFAVDCVEHALDGMKNSPPDQDKLREVLSVCRRFANGEATQVELSAARGAARAAARDAAWDAAWAAARDAAWAAARDAAWDAAWAAARDQEIAWQSTRLIEYLEGKIGVSV